MTTKMKWRWGAWMLLLCGWIPVLKNAPGLVSWLGLGFGWEFVVGIAYPLLCFLLAGHLMNRGLLSEARDTPKCREESPDPILEEALAEVERLLGSRREPGERDA